MNVGRMSGMRKIQWWARGCSLPVCAALGLALAVAADFEVTGPDERRILLKDDRTWSYVDGRDSSRATARAGRYSGGISDQDVTRLQVSGGDRCVMGDLDRRLRG